MSIYVGGCLLEFLHALRKRACKLLLFVPNDLFDQLIRFVALQFGIRFFILFNEDNRRAHQHAVFLVFVPKPELHGMLRCATQEAAQHIPALGVRRNHAVVNNKHRGADVIGNDAERTSIAAVGILLAGKVFE